LAVTGATHTDIIMSTHSSHTQSDEAGQAMVEYSLILLFIALACFVMLGFVGDGVSNALQPILNGFSGA
jgi:Flp pilus assembly pilin Flp